MSKPDRYISRLRLSGFRNYSSAALDLDYRHVVLTGPNGAGKTNLIEALSLLSPGRGLRAVPFDLLAGAGGDGRWAVAATIETPQGPIDMGTGNNPPDPGRKVRINGATVRALEEMSAHLRLLWLTPAMDGLFTGPAADRRRFLDRLVMTLIPGHGLSVSGFDKAMRQRNRLLEDKGEAIWLDAIESQMAGFAAAIYFSRADSLGHLQHLATKDMETAFPSAILALTPLFVQEEAFASSTALEQALVEHWRASRPEDRAARRTLLGPHRVDLGVTHAQKAMPARLCSTGEQKGLLIGLVLAHARLVADMAGLIPLLLLDEIAAHLDPERRAALFLALDRLNTQVWMTGTDPILFEQMDKKAQKVSVSDGSLSLMA